jgi:hypothetical protein
MMDSPHITYIPHPDATLEKELSALVSAYRFVIFDCNVSKKGARPGAPDDAESLNNDRTDTEIIPR